MDGPVLETHDRFLVVRDDMLPGGTKRRALEPVLRRRGRAGYVYATPAVGYAQMALAYACAELGLPATVFVAERKELHPRTAEAQRVGAQVVQVPMGFLSNVTAKARAYATSVDHELLPFGLDLPEFRAELTKVARLLEVRPPEVWTVAGSGTLTRALQDARPDAKFFAVRVGARGTDIGRATELIAPERYERPAQDPPPFPSCDNYDAKAWRFMKKMGAPGALFWNVGA